MQGEHCNIVLSITESIQHYSTVHIVRLHTCSVDEKSELLRTQLFSQHLAAPLDQPRPL